MKKVLTLLMLLCMVCTGAWAENITAVSQFVQGQVISLYNAGTSKYVYCSNSNNQLKWQNGAPSDDRKLVLIGDNTNGFLLYCPQIQKYVKDLIADNNITPLTANAYEAGIYTFEACASGPDNSFSIKNLSYTGSHQYMHINTATAGVIPWNAGSSSSAASCWQIANEGTADVPSMDFSALTVYDENVNNEVVGYAKKGSQHPIAQFVANKTVDNYRKAHIFINNKANSIAYATLNALEVNKPVAGKAYTIRVNYAGGSATRYLVMNSNSELVATTSLADAASASAAMWTVDENGKLQNGRFTDYYITYANQLGIGSTGANFNFPAGVKYGTLGICSGTVASAVQVDGTYTSGKFSNTLFDQYGNWSCDYVFEDALGDLQDEVNEVMIAITGKRIGWPNVDNSVNTSAISTLMEYQGYLGMSPITASNYGDAKAALAAVYALTDINLPEDGKAYTFTYLCKDLTKTYSYYDNNGALGTRMNADLTAPETHFVCKVNGDKFVFVNAATGRYLSFAGGDAGALYTGQDGMEETYRTETNGNLSDLQLNSLNGNSSYVYGTFSLAGVRNNNQIWATFVTNVNNGALNANGSANNNLYNDSYTTVCRIEEVENPNKLKLSNPNEGGTNSLDGKSVGTFSAPYNVELPEGVAAYVATLNSEKAIVTFTELGEGEHRIVPKNTGVLVYAAEGKTFDNVNAIPAATASVPAIAENSNIFLPMVDGEISIGDYVLGKGSNGVGFYARVTAANVKNKAYIPATTAQQIRSFRFDFEEPTTGIETLQGVPTAGMAYDLSGRCIKANTKGVSIVNGKKYIK